MTEQQHDALWRDFPKTAMEFESRFATEADCRSYWIEARWGGKPVCAACQGERVWTTRDGTTFECAECSHQTSLTAGTLLHKTHKPLKMWFRAVFEISSRRLESEYGAVSRLEAAPWTVVRWLPVGMSEDALDALSLPTGSRLAYDLGKNAVVLFPNEWSAGYFGETNKGVTLSALPVQSVRE